MPLGEAQAVLGAKTTTHIEPLDASADSKALHKAGVWCRRFSPLVALEEPDSLILNVSGCSHLFGGEQQLAQKVVLQLRERGYVSRVAVADTPNAAWAVAHFAARPIQVVPSDMQGKFLHGLPLAALRLPDEIVKTFRELDIHYIGQLMQLPERLLPSRFGPQVLLGLHQALGTVANPLTTEGFVEQKEASWRFEIPCTSKHLLEQVIEHLLAKLLERPPTQHQAIQRLHVTFHHTAKECSRLEIGLLRASRSLRYLMELVRLHLERAKLDREVTEVTIRPVSLALSYRQGQLFEGDSSLERIQEFPVLVEKLSSRLGKNAILRPCLQDDPQPEYAWRYDPWLEQGVSDLTDAVSPEPDKEESFRPSHFKRRPVPVTVVSVFPNGPPLRFEWEHRSLVVAHYWGPERIETGWWRDAEIGRDYYLVETTKGERFWLYCQVDRGQWFLHGTFA